jgi:hypothetical protein
MALKPPSALVMSPVGDVLPFVEPNQSVNRRQKLRLPYAEHESPTPYRLASAAALGVYGV